MMEMETTSFPTEEHRYVGRHTIQRCESEQLSPTKKSRNEKREFTMRTNQRKTHLATLSSSQTFKIDFEIYCSFFQQISFENCWTSSDNISSLRSKMVDSEFIASLMHAYCMALLSFNLFVCIEWDKISPFLHSSLSSRSEEMVIRTSEKTRTPRRKSS